MPRDPLFSVVIATYNRAAFVREAVDSVLAQTETDFELIVVDDGSNDGTREALATYGDRLRYVFRENTGMAGARNRGIREARGELIALLDSDDLFLPRCLEAGRKLFELHPRAGAIFLAERIFDEAGEVQPRVYSKRSEGAWFTPMGMITTDTRVGSGRPPIVRRALLEEFGGYDEGLCGAWDSELWIRLSFKTPMTILEEPLILKRVHGENFSADRVKDGLAWLEILDRVERDHPELAAENTWALRRDRGKQHVRIGASLLARSAEDRRSLSEARRHLLLGLRHYPLFLRAWSYLLTSLLGPGAYSWLHALGARTVKRLNLGPRRLPAVQRRERRSG